MGRKKVEAGTRKERPRRGTAKVSSSPVKVFQDTILASTGVSEVGVASASSSSQPLVADRQPLADTQPNVPTFVRPMASERKVKVGLKMSAEDQARLHAVQQLCSAIDAEVLARSAAIRAVTTAQTASFELQMDIQLSKFSPQEQNMPLSELLKSCPGIQCVTTFDGNIYLQRSGSAYAKLQDSKKNLHDLLTKARDSESKANSSSFFTPSARHHISSARKIHSGEEEEEADQKGGEELSWPEYYARLQTMGYGTGLTDSLKSPSKQDTAVSSKGGLMRGVTPKTLRVPKQGETMLSINGSPLGQFGKTPGYSDTTRVTSTRAMLRSSKRSLRDL